MSSETLTIGEALSLGSDAIAAAGIQDARSEATQLLMFAASLTREQVVLKFDEALTSRARIIYDKAVSLRVERRPLAYITGERWFYGRPFKINRAVLIPRPETELLVDVAVELGLEHAADFIVADIGTGSGCIAVSIATELPSARVFAVDLSNQALLLAQKNVKRHGVADRVTLLEGDLLAPLDGKQFDLIVSNPPYIKEADVPGLMPEVGKYEPSMALWRGAGPDGIALHRRLLDAARQQLLPGGWIAMEAGLGQTESICLIAENYGYKTIRTIRDLGSIDRVVAVQWNC